MFTHRVREKLAHDYGIKCIPNDLLIYLVQKHRAKLDRRDVPTITWAVANEWQRGLDKEPMQ